MLDGVACLRTLHLNNLNCMRLEERGWLRRGLVLLFSFFSSQASSGQAVSRKSILFLFFSFQKCEIWCVVRHLADGAVQKECKLTWGIPILLIRSWKAPGLSENSHFALKTSLDMLGSTDGSYLNQRSVPPRSDFVCHFCVVFKGAGVSIAWKPPVGCRGMGKNVDVK